MFTLLLQIALALIALMVLGTVLKIIVLPFALLAGLIGFVTHNAVPILLVGGLGWYLYSRSRKQLPGS